MRKFLLAVAAVLALLLAAFAWLLATTSGARVTLSLVERLSGGALQVQGIDGRLAGPLRMERLILDQPDRRMTFSDVRLAWRPGALLRQTLHIESLHAGHLQLDDKGDRKTEPVTLPESISLPFRLRADDVRLGSGTFGEALRLGPLAFALAFDGSQYRLQLQRLALGSMQETAQFSADVSGRATVSTAKPYAVEGLFTSSSKATVQERAVGAAGTVALGGSLEQLETAIDLAVNDARARGKTVLHPFAATALGQTLLEVEALDLSRFDPALPLTALDIRLSIAATGAGELQLRNPAAGAYNDRRLPLHALLLAFRQNDAQFVFERMSASLGSARRSAGEVTGHGQYADGSLDLTLKTEALDMKRIDNRARSTQLAGEAVLHHSPSGQTFRIALAEPLKGQRITLDAEGALSDKALSIQQARLRAGSGLLEFSGHLSLAGRQEFRAQGEIARLRPRTLGDFPQLPDLDLNGRFSLQGRRMPVLEADLAFKIHDSLLEGQVLAGDGEVQLRGERLQVPRFHLVSGANRLNIEGQLAEGETQLEFALNAPRLAQLGPGFDGAMQANGVVRGTLTRPRIQAEWSATGARLPWRLDVDAMQGKADVSLDRNRPFILDSAAAELSMRGLRYGDVRLTRLSSQMRFSPQPEAPLAMKLAGEGLSSGELRVERIDLAATGSTAVHALDARLAENGQTWSMTANGGLANLTDSPQWKGKITSMDAAGRFVARLVAPSPLLLSPEQFQLEDFLLDADAGRIAVGRFTRTPDGIVTRGRIERLQLAQLLRHIRPAPPIRTDLALSGEWDVRIADAISGTLTLRRDRGDLTVLAATPVPLGLRTFAATATAAAGRLTLQLQAEGRQLGGIDLHAATAIGTFGADSSRAGIAPDAPLEGRARVDVPSLAWIAPLIAPSLFLDGRLQSDIALGGNLEQPRIAGRIMGDALRVSYAELGVDLRSGKLDSSFEGDRLQIRDLSFQGAEGSVSLSGPIDFGGGSIAAQLGLRAERFALVNSTDRRIVVSGSSEALWRDGRGRLAGTFTVNSGFIDLGHAGKPQLSSDVVIVGKEKQAGAKTPLAIDLTIALGEGINLTGRGIDALLGGQVRLLSDAGETLQAQGTLHIVKGTYSAYGRELAIEQGLLRFRGALNNPALDILAMRRGQEVEAGVSIRGTALTPRVALVSEPPVPDAEKLSWLVLGRGLAAAGDTDVGALQSAAAALLSEGAKAGVQSRIASAFGLDTFSIGTSQDNLQQRVVTLGKQISSRLYLSYQQGLESAGSVVQLRYTLSPKLSLEAEAGARSALSLFYNIAFD